MNQTMTRTRQATPERWARALQRAMAANLAYMELIGGDGSWAISSTRDNERGYITTTDTCTCEAGRAGDEVCCHRALVRALTGMMPEPSRIAITGSSDRQDITVDGRHFGFAAFTDDTGWTLWQGEFPRAKWRGNFATLDEIERYLEERLPVSLPVAPAVPAADLVAVA